MLIRIGYSKSKYPVVTDFEGTISEWKKLMKHDFFSKEIERRNREQDIQ